MNKIILISAILGATLGAAQAQTTIADWDFDLPYVGAQAAPYNTPLATVGALAGIAQATQLGMNNGYTFGGGEGPGSVAYCDVLASAGASTGSGSYGWRVRGETNVGGLGPGYSNGWNTNAPIATQGALFQASTAGFTSNSITVSFDINVTGQAERNLALLYTLDGVTWIDATISSVGALGTIANNTTSTNTIIGSYVKLSSSGTGWNNQITANIAGAGGDANFAIEIVNASTGADDVNSSGNPLNNSSGNWRYDNVDITGIAVPEPCTLGLAGLGLASLLAFRRGSRKA